jgi:hypothetical protein
MHREHKNKSVEKQPLAIFINAGIAGKNCGHPRVVRANTLNQFALW